MSSFKGWLGTLSLVAATLLLVVAIPTTSHATSQWARKYKTSCTTCHTAFPRLNYYGERFMRNGYQDPDNATPDGGTLGKKVINENLALDQLQNHFGIRLSLTPLRSQSNGIVVNGEDKARLTVGGVDWYQFFIAGAINKNLSIFVESENNGHEMHFSWYHIGIHNIGGSSMMNFFIGQLSPLDFTSYSNRLRQIGSVKADVFGIVTSGGASEDGMNTSSARPGIMWYGTQGPLVLSAGVSNGASAADVNDQMHYWAAARFEIPESMESAFEGSNVSIWYYKGTDAIDTASDQKTNDFDRVALQANIRNGAWDLQYSYLTVTEDNYLLAAADAPQTEMKYGGNVLQLGYRTGPWYVSCLYDDVTYNDEAYVGMERSHITPSVSYFFYDNVRAEAHVRIDNTDETADYTRSNDFRVNLRTMF